MGKDGGGIPGSPTDKQQAKKLKAVEAQVGEPTRGVVVPKALDTLTNQNPFATSLPSSSRDTYEKQFAQANADIQAGAGGRGGMLRNALVQNANQRAATIAKANDDYRQLGIERALGTLVPAAIPDARTQASMAANIANNENQRNIANYQSQQQGQQALLGGLGGLAGLFLGK